MARFGQTRREQLAHAVGSLEDVGASVLGAVFTMTPTRGNASYSYSYSYYGEDANKPSSMTRKSTAAAAKPSPVAADAAPTVKVKHEASE
jgi:receptor protein-tyrosine kinase